MTYDLYFSAVNSDGKTLGFTTKKTQAVTGLTKLALRFVKHLLTPAGTEISGNVIGTSLPELAGSNIADQAYATATVNLSVKQAVDQIKKTQVGRADEALLDTVKVTGVVFGANRVDVTVEIVTIDGTTASLNLPTISTAA